MKVQSDQGVVDVDLSDVDFAGFVITTLRITIVGDDSSTRLS